SFFLFFFSGHGYPRALHSFPTRRSSDLTAKLVIVEGVLRVRLGVEKIARVERVIAEILEPAAVKLVGATLGDDVDDRTGVAPVLDRKSTRLNSSHLVISYAVFCLKKKT